jgi:hypothetical protein
LQPCKQVNVKSSTNCNLKSIGARVEQTAGRFRGVQRASSDRLRGVHLGFTLSDCTDSNLDAADLYAALAEQERRLISERTRPRRRSTRPAAQAWQSDQHS